jgi:hypothetical protein
MGRLSQGGRKWLFGQTQLRGFSRELGLGWRRSEGSDAVCVSGPLGGVCRRRPAGEGGSGMGGKVG